MNYRSIGRRANSLDKKSHAGYNGANSYRSMMGKQSLFADREPVVGANRQQRRRHSAPETADDESARYAGYSVKAVQELDAPCGNKGGTTG
jgi:hypothetical protein